MSPNARFSWPKIYLGALCGLLSPLTSHLVAQFAFCFQENFSLWDCKCFSFHINFGMNLTLKGPQMIRKTTETILFRIKIQNTLHARMTKSEKNVAIENIVIR